MKNVKQRIDQSVKYLREKLKYELIYQLSAEYAAVGLRLVTQAVNEADALASLTPVPTLVLPALAEEKVQQAAAWSARQRSVLASVSRTFAA
ncbi:MAG TPA: hypothetical protein VGO67_10625 [Verrucomicrobiae bacterium]|jgi:hypothetical protein